MLSIRSLNVGIPRQVTANAGLTGIDKRPVDGPVLVQEPVGRPGGSGSSRVSGSGVSGDSVCDRENHGGTDQAVYAYAREDLDRWEVDLGRQLPDGTFGENLTTHGGDINETLIGERWRVGSALLQVTVPRIPCRTFAQWLGRDGWVKTFTERAAPGVYFRVVEPGHLGRGDAVAVEHRPRHGVSIRTVFRALLTNPELLPALVDVDELPTDVRDRARRRLPFTVDDA